MFNIISLGSGSSGNCYVLEKNGETVILEAGIDFKKIASGYIKNGLSLTGLLGVIVSHRHNDHSLSTKEFSDLDRDIYGTSDVNYVNHVVSNKDTFQIGSWLKVAVISVKHDVECNGYILFDPTDKYSVLFITDTAPFNFIYKEIVWDKVLIECNYDEREMEANLEKAIDERELVKVRKYKRQMQTHLSLEGTKRMLDQLKGVKEEIILLHLSAELGNAEKFVKEIREHTNIKTSAFLKNGEKYIDL